MPAAVNRSPNGTRAPDKVRKAGVVPLKLTEENHHNRARGARIPAHSYHVHWYTKKYVRENRASRAGPCAA